MSEEQLSALLAKLKDDAGLREKLKGAADLEASVAIAKEAGFDVSKADWLKRQKPKEELTDAELERIGGGTHWGPTEDRYITDAYRDPLCAIEEYNYYGNG